MYAASCCGLHTPRARMEFSDQVQFRTTCAIALRRNLVFLISSRRLLRLTFRLTFLRLRAHIVSTVLACHSLCPVFSAMCHQRPGDTCHFIGQRYPYQHGWLALQHPGQPRTWCGPFMLGPSDHSAGSNNEEASQSSVSHL